MSYFPSAREAARVLGVPLLLRENPDSRAFRRHDWLGTLAVPAVSAARMYALAFDEMSRAVGGVMGVGRENPAPPGAIWVTGPWGSLAHLPWAVGLADHLARTRGRAGLIEREPDGPLRTLARAGRRIPVRLSPAEALLGGPVDAVNTDLEGVSILLRRGGEAPVEGGTTDAAAGDFPLVLADGLPEALEGPYPGADCVAGVILVASFRDHSRFELDAIVRRLRETGHRLLGLTAIGPEVSEAEEAAALRTEEEAEPTVREAARAKQEAQRVRADAAAAKVKAAPPMETGPAQAGRPHSAASPRIWVKDILPTAVKIFLSPPGAARPASGSASDPHPPPARLSEPEPKSRPVPGTLSGFTLERVPETAPEAVPESVPETVPETAPESVPETPPQAGLETRLDAEPELGGPSAQRDDRITIQLLSTWDRLAISRSRRRRRAGVGVTVLLVLAVAAAFYGIVLRPRLRPSSEPRSSEMGSAALPTEGADSAGAVARLVADSTASAAESTGTAAAWAETAAESIRSADESTLATGESTGTTAGSTGTAADTGRVATDAGRTPGQESGNRLRRPGPGFVPGSAAGPRADSNAVPVASPGFGESAGAADTTVALPGGAGGDPGERFVIHLTSFKFEAEAESEIAARRLRGIEARSIEVEIPDRGTWYRIVTGNFATFAEAESVALRLQAEGKIPYAHIAADGGRGQPVPVGTLDRARP